ncbi:3'(2'),5'-bisphosphate nucleotidase CysQ [Rhodocyclaceae bacterium]
MAIYREDFAVAEKGDGSPVTLADERAEALIVARLAAVAPGIPVVAEEAAAAGKNTTAGELFWLVDPLDGTKEFINRNGEFTINIALVSRGIPIAGVVSAPALGKIFAGAAGTGAFIEDARGRHPIACRVPPAEGLTVVSSRSHGDAGKLEEFLSGRKVASNVGAGSSLKFCLVATGEADLYPRFGRTMEWDTAAGHAVLLAAGGTVSDLAGAPLSYGKPGFENPHFIARGLPSQD